LNYLDLTPFVDYITRVEDVGDQFLLRKDFYKHVMYLENKEMICEVYNILTEKVRRVSLKPSRNWENADGLLGLKIRYSIIAEAQSAIFRVLNVIENGPASKADICIGTDFIIGCIQFEFLD